MIIGSKSQSLFGIRKGCQTEIKPATWEVNPSPRCSARAYYSANTLFRAKRCAPVRENQLEPLQYTDQQTYQEFVATRFTGCGSGQPGLLQCHQNSSQKFYPTRSSKNHIPCWDAECENLYHTLLQSPEGSDSNRVATALLPRLDNKRRDRWSEAVQSIDFSHSSRKASNILNNLTDRSRLSPRHCAISANAIASQLIRNGRYEDIDRESSRKKCQIFGGPLQKSSEHL